MFIIPGGLFGITGRLRVNPVEDLPRRFGNRGSRGNVAAPRVMPSRRLTGGTKSSMLGSMNAEYTRLCRRAAGCLALALLLGACSGSPGLRAGPPSPSLNCMPDERPVCRTSGSRLERGSAYGCICGRFPGLPGN